MDYCSSCRRHLNGALVCPGCGAYAPDIAPVTRAGRVTPALATPAAWPEPDPAPGGEPSDGFDDTGDVEGVPSAPAGRAARRRQQARWKKNQRRAVVATAVALVGGGLTVASMDRGSGDRSQASAGPDLTSMGAEDQPAVEPSDTPSTASPTAHRASRGGSDRSATNGVPRQRTGVSAPSTDSAYAQPYTASTTSHSSTTARQQTASTPSTSSNTTTTTTASGSGTSTNSSTGTSTGTGTTAGQSTSSSSSSSSGGSSGTSSQSSSGSGTASTSPSGLCVLNLICVN